MILLIESIKADWPRFLVVILVIVFGVGCLAALPGCSV